MVCKEPKFRPTIELNGLDGTTNELEGDIHFRILQMPWRQLSRLANLLDVGVLQCFPLPAKHILLSSFHCCRFLLTSGKSLSNCPTLDPIVDRSFPASAERKAEELFEDQDAK